LLLVQTLLSIFIVLLPQIFILQDFISAVDLQEGVMSRLIILQDNTDVE
jgi:hypothetical protein